MTTDILDEMDLPYSSDKESLETISNNKLKPFFDVEKFEIRDEKERDKGIDLSIEAKKLNAKGQVVYTNFRFVVQLKATSIDRMNEDGSISLSIRTSNINYLLNNGMPAYYVLFDATNNLFYVKHLNEFIQELEKSKPDWVKQENHTIRFHQKLTDDFLDQMHEDTLSRGVLNRTINEKILWSGSGSRLDSSISIHGNLEVTDDKDVQTLIEEVGFHLINEGRWNEILSMHNNISGRLSSSKLYNLILGTANYYSGNLMDAISFFRKVKLAEGDLEESLVKHLKYLEVSAKRIVGIFNEEEYEESITELIGEDDLGLHALMEKCRMDIFKAEKSEIADAHINYINKLDEIIRNEKSSIGVKLNAGAEKILFLGLYNNLRFVTSVSAINGHEANNPPNAEMRAELAVLMIQGNANWYKEVLALKDDAKAAKNWFAYYTILLNEVQIRYKFYVYASQVKVRKELPEFPKVDMPDKEETMNVLLPMLDEAEAYFNKVGHIQNISAVLACRYEIIHFMDKEDDADEILKRLEHIVETYDVKEQREKLNFLKVNGPTHAINEKHMEETVGKAEKIFQEIELFRNKMIELDEKENQQELPQIEESYIIQLFPIGYFKFPQNKKEVVFDILRAGDNAKIACDNIFSIGAIPVVNIYYSKIEQEGFLDGKMADAGFDSWKNLYRVRKEFFDHGFHRVELQN